MWFKIIQNIWNIPFGNPQKKSNSLLQSAKIFFSHSLFFCTFPFTASFMQYYFNKTYFLVDLIVMAYDLFDLCDSGGYSNFIYLCTIAFHSSFLFFFFFTFQIILLHMLGLFFFLPSQTFMHQFIVWLASELSIPLSERKNK